jgi:hypothetical protein
MSRGFRSFADVMPQFLQTFDAEDGLAACPRRNETVTAPQALFMMNHSLVEDVANRMAARLTEASGADLAAAVVLGYRVGLGRPPTDNERTKALAFIPTDPEGIKGLVWLLLNLDEFLYVR